MNAVLNRDTTDNTILDRCMDILSHAFPDIFWDELGFDLTARGYYTQTVYEQMRAVVRQALEMARNKPDRVFQAFLDAPEDKINALAAEVAVQVWQSEPSKALSRLKKVVRKSGVWAREWSAVGVHRLGMANGIEVLLDHVRTWVHDEDPIVRRMVLAGLRPRLPQVPVFDEIRKSPGYLRPVLEMTMAETDADVLAAASACLSDLAHDNPAKVLEWVEAWWLQDLPAPYRGMVTKGLEGLVDAGNPRALAVLGYQRLDKARVSWLEPAPELLSRNQVIHCNLALEGVPDTAIVLHLSLSHVDSPNAASVVRLVEEKRPGGTVWRGSLHFVDTAKQARARGDYLLKVLVNGWVADERTVRYRKMKDA